MKSQQHIEDMLVQLAERTAEPIHLDLAERIKQDIPSKLHIQLSRQEVFHMILKSNRTKWAVAAAMVLVFLSLLPLLDYRPPAGLLWADVLQAVDNAPGMHMKITTDLPRVEQPETADIWIDLTQKVAILKSVDTHGKVRYQRYDGQEELCQTYVPASNQLTEEILAGDELKLLSSLHRPLNFLLQMSSTYVDQASNLENYQATPRGNLTDFSFRIERPDNPDEFHELLITVENRTQRPIAYALRTGNQRLDAVIDYPAFLPTTFEDLGIDISRAVPPSPPDPNDQRVLRGRLLDEVGNPLAGYVVYQSDNKLISVGEDGTFAIVLPGYFHGNEFIWAKAEHLMAGYVFASHQVPEFINLTLRRPARITGRLVDKQGQPVTQADISLGVKTGKTSGMGLGQPPWNLQLMPDGTFTVSQIPVGVTYSRLSFQRPGYYTGIEIGDLLSGQTRELGDVTLNAAHGFDDTIQWDRKLKGRVLNELGVPLWKARVYTSYPGAGNFEDETDYEGTFMLEGLPRGRKVEMRVYYPQYGHVTFMLNEETEDAGDLQIFPQGYRWYGLEAPEPKVEKWLNCDPVRLADFRGKVILLQVGTYMEPKERFHDEKYIDRMISLQSRYKEQGLQVIMIHQPLEVWPGPTTEVEILAFIQEKQITIPVGLDSSGAQTRDGRSLRDGETQFLYDVRATPAHFVIDRKGILQRCVQERYLEKWIEYYLAEPAE